MQAKLGFKQKLLLFIAFLLLCVLSWQNSGALRFQQIGPAPIFSYQLSMEFKPNDKDLFVATYLPIDNPRQRVIEEAVSADNMTLQREVSEQGDAARWDGDKFSKRISYQALLKNSSVKYQIDDQILIGAIDPELFQSTLSETEAIAVNHPEIIQAWESIKPASDKFVLPVVQAIFDYTQQLETLPFKGFTSSLTALRLGAASCNGKSRLFASLARLNGIPTRLVGGVIMNTGKKKTSHQWVEVYVLGRWVPFDPTNGYFAEIPAHYLELYRGDLSLFRHSPNIQFDYQFNTKDKFVSPTYHPELNDNTSQGFNLATELKSFKLPDNVITSFLLFPFCALVITFMRNVVGLQTFGVFVPLLLAVACTYTGIYIGLTGIGLIVVLAFVSLKLMEKARVLKIPRLSATISVITIAMLGWIFTSDIHREVNLAVVALLPVVIISFLAEKLLQLSSEGDWLGVVTKTLGTLVVVVLCYASIQSIYLQGLFAVFPEAFLLVLGLQVLIGRWNGIRLSEQFRFKSLLAKGDSVIGINERNREAVYRLNSPELLLLASDKLKTKAVLSQHNIPAPRTLASCSQVSQVQSLTEVFDSQNQFVIKPNMGSQGNGIIVISEVSDETFITPGGKRFSAEELLAHSQDILCGTFSQNGDIDQVYIEPMIRQHDVLQLLAPSGLADIRVIVINHQIAAAMLRLPTEKSNGKANLHQGAIGVSVDTETGRLNQATQKGKKLDWHPDSQVAFAGLTIPDWDKVRKISLACAKAIPLGYLGVDVCIDRDEGPLVLEVNGRPGLEIQNIQGKPIERQLIYQTAETV